MISKHEVTFHEEVSTLIAESQQLCFALKTFFLALIENSPLIKYINLSDR